MVTDPSEDACELVFKPLRNTIENAESPSVKAAAIHALGVVTFYGGVVESETLEVMSFFVEIVESDGAILGAEDDADVVTAALEEWAFLPSQGFLLATEIW